APVLSMLSLHDALPICPPLPSPHGSSASPPSPSPQEGSGHPPRPLAGDPDRADRRRPRVLRRQGAPRPLSLRRQVDRHRDAERRSEEHTSELQSRENLV